MAKELCPGSRAAPRAMVENDPWIGVTVICPVCFRSLKPSKVGSMPRHQRPNCAAETRKDEVAP